MNDLLHDHSRWGTGDQLGAGNLLTQERRLSALRSIATGQIYDLSHDQPGCAVHGAEPDPVPYVDLGLVAGFDQAPPQDRRDQ
jgi:hypothetical protein